MSEIKIPDNYEPKLDLLQTEMAIKLIKDTFERRLGESLRLTRVSAPLFVNARTGLNDNLNGIERPVQFDIPDIQENHIIDIPAIGKKYH